MDFKVISHRYSEEQHRLHFTAIGQRDGVRFSAVTHVTCLKDPKTPERVHMAVLLKLTEIFKRQSASGR